MISSLRVSLLLAALALPWSLSAAEKKASSFPATPSIVFEKRLGTEDYQKAISAYDLDRIDPKKVAASKFPAYATMVASVKEGGQADAAGLKKGWRIVALNDREIWEHRQSLPMEGGKREIRAISPGGETKILEFEDGTIGTSSINSHLPEVWVLQNIPRGAWDEDMLVAAVAWSAGNHELAETALRLAVDHGMPKNPVLTHFSSLLALDRGDYAQARTLNAALMKTLPEGETIPHFYAGGIRTLAACLGDFALMKRAAQDCEGLNRTILQPEMAGLWQSWKAKGEKPPLLPRAKAAAGPNLLSQCESVTVKWQAAAYVMDFEPARDGTYIKEIPPGRYDRLSFAPPGAVQNMIWTVRFAYRKTEPTDVSCSLGICLADRQGKSGWAKSARFLPFDKAAVLFNVVRAPGMSNYVELSAGPCGQQFASQCDLPEMTEQEFALFKGLVEANSPESKKVTRHVNEVSLIRIGDEAEIVLNGKSLLHVPVDPEVEDLFCLLQTEGISLVVDGMTVSKIGE